MFQILVPVDFYQTSFTAFIYATNFSKLFPKAEITLLHVINGKFNLNDVVTYDPMIELKEVALKKLKYFQENIPHELGATLPEININRDVRIGIPGFTIGDYANTNNIDLIIMGTRDQHNLFDKMLGSSSAIAIRESECPVMLIHENMKFTPPNKIVFAFDNKSNLEKALENYIKLNSIIKAKTDFVHISKNINTNIEHQKREIIDELFEDNEPSFTFEMKTIQGNDVLKTIKDYCLSEKSDILTMVHRKEGLFTSIFRTHHSIKMAQEFHLPVLVFHEAN